MAQEVKDDLALAIETVARTKREAYDRAHSGKTLTNFNWMNQNPALAAAVAKLNSSMVECDGIPMSDA